MTPPCVALPLYRPRDSQASDLCALMDQHFPTFQQVYGERFHAKYGFWRPVVERSVTAFLQCVDLGSHRGPGGPGRATAQGRPAPPLIHGGRPLRASFRKASAQFLQNTCIIRKSGYTEW